MTEAEATTRWCPFSRLLAHTYAQQGEVRVETGYSYNRSPDPDETRAPYLPDGASCIASACMAWRRQTVMIDRTTGEPAVPGVSKPESLEERYSAHGYCGLAGAPS